MDDPELQALRAKRLQELQMQYGGKSTSDNSQSNPHQQQAQALQESKEKEEEFRNSILSQILTQAARARRKPLHFHSLIVLTNLDYYFISAQKVSNISLAKPERGKMLENLLIANAQRGIIREKYDRRKTVIDDSDQDEDDELS
ncbi:programmed cell death protein 5-like protein [Sarcoptes scabiei]|uniref:Programmed cell death protein 5-like protein n=1 Tax=Sarcoptes scabiei TaxID=52283 RepID=A0A131ZSW3_SARSC|nr:programmed cell death protein 5-like protein [Sarcoptes scabiei]